MLSVTVRMMYISSTIWIFFSLSIYFRLASAKGMEKESVSSPLTSPVTMMP